MTEKEIFSKLFDMSSAELHEMFDCDDVEDVINRITYANIIDKLSEPRYGDVYVHSGDGDKAVFLHKGSNKYWLLFEDTPCPQEYTPSHFRASFVKIGNVADKLRGLFE